jgi:hypothetical protein
MYVSVDRTGDLVRAMFTSSDRTPSTMEWVNVEHPQGEASSALCRPITDALHPSCAGSVRYGQALRE